ncbi:MAG: phosphodiester glycosidase family protein [Truepera sp.]|nr:phosphodiester glycosidase family protein [Truepera sp.]
MRVVLEFEGLSRESLAPLTTDTLSQTGGRLQLTLPEVLILTPAGASGSRLGFKWSIKERGQRPHFELTGPSTYFRISDLAEPTRLVIDLFLQPPEPFRQTTQELRQGIRYRTFPAEGGLGPSRVHLLEVASGAGDFLVVGESGVPRTLSELAVGAFAAINGGYFDPGSFDVIGQLRVDYGLLSSPSPNRAAVAFSAEGPLIARVGALVDIRIDGRLHRAERSPPLWSVAIVPGQLAGSPRLGVIMVEAGRVTANRIGPLTVPENGFAVVYAPEVRELALVDAGARAGLEFRFDPPSFGRVRYALEAGPLLLKRGQPAFAPEEEGFRRGTRILDGLTQQSGIGYRADGTVLLVVAEAMRAEDLVSLFTALGAEAAMRLDSGSSATLLIDGRVVNRDRERKIASAIVLVVPD